MPHFSLALLRAYVGGTGLSVDEFLVHGDQAGFFELADMAGEVALGELQFFQQGVEIHRPARQRKVRHDGKPRPVRQQRIDAHEVGGFHDIARLRDKRFLLLLPQGQSGSGQACH